MLAALAIIVLAGALTGGAIASATTTPKSTPWPHSNGRVFFYVDTEAAATEGIYGDCEQASEFQPGQQILFRAAAQFQKTGANVEPAQVKTFEVLVPGVAPIPLEWGIHSYGVVAGDPSPEYWTGVWTVPENYPLGVVSFRVYMVTKTSPSYAVAWRQIPIVTSSLTIVPAETTTTTTTS